MSSRIAALTILALTLVTGCTTTEMISFDVESQPPGARIEVNGLDRGITPTKLQLEAKKTWSPFAPGGWQIHKTAYEVVAYPPETVESNQRQSKVIDLQQTSQGGKMFFDFTRAEPAK